jgi:hypothetical protein
MLPYSHPPIFPTFPPSHIPTFIPLLQNVNFGGRRSVVFAITQYAKLMNIT